MNAALQFATVWVGVAAILLALARLRLSRPRALVVALLIGFAAASALCLTAAGGLIYGLFAPWPVTILVLGAFFLFRPFGIGARVWSVPELAGFAALSILLLVSAFGLLPVDLFAPGYHPITGAMFSAAIIAYAWWRHDVPLGIAAFLAHLTWMAGLGPDNVLNHLTSVPLLGLALWSMVERIVWPGPVPHDSKGADTGLNSGDHAS